MKKYLLTVLALGATMMMACNPGETEKPEVPGGGEDVPADYTLAGEGLMGTFTNSGDAYEVGTNVCMITLSGVDNEENPTKLMMFTMEYNVPAEEMNGAGVLAPDTIDPESGAYTFAPNTYMPGFQDPEDPDYPFGTYYQEQDYNTEAFLVTELVVSGDVTVTFVDGVHTVSGVLTLNSGKVLKVMYSGTLMSYSSAVKFLKK